VILPLLLFALGLALSAFFSGTETGYYRATRVRLVLDALGGNWISRGLLWLANHPSVFVATTLVGNNLANSTVSLAVVMAADALFGPTSRFAGLLAPIVVVPLVFILGELFPKHVFYHAPNRMLRACGPGILAATWLLAPVSVLLWGLGRMMQWMMGNPLQPVQPALARRELEQVFQEGHDAGILRPVQRSLVTGLFAAAGRPVRPYITATHRMPTIRPGMSFGEIVQLARRQGVAVLPVEDPRRPGRFSGYLRVADLYLQGPSRLPPSRPLVVLSEDDDYLTALLRLQRSPEWLAQVVSASGETIGFLSRMKLSDALLNAV
jgi:CBS domain containing-hemolysin-like protein